MASRGGGNELRTLSQLEQQEVDAERLIRRIPFFNQISQLGLDQFHTLLNIADIVEANPGDVIIQKGADDACFYFLLKGQLDVLLELDDGDVVNQVLPGEVFGVLSMVAQSQRSAFIRASGNRPALLFRMNSGALVEPTGQTRLSLSSRLTFYRMALHNIRWTLEKNKMAEPGHPLVEDIRRLPFANPPKDTEEELASLKEQTMLLAEILMRWNQTATLSGKLNDA